MRHYFADALYYLAVLNPADEFHKKAIELSSDPAIEITTSAWVITEVIDALSKPSRRFAVAPFLRGIQFDAFAHIVPPEPELFNRGIELFLLRPDKGWSLTDCISFLIMQDHRLTEALTADHHFTQAGFHILL